MQCSFDHWQIINEDPLETNSYAYKIMMNTRKRKGLKTEIPLLKDYLDKL